MEDTLMSTTKERNDDELKLDAMASESYSPEMETSIWYN